MTRKPERMSEIPKIVPRPRMRAGAKRRIDEIKVATLYNAGKGDAEIAATLGCAKSSVSRIVARMVKEQNERAKK